MRVTAAHPRGKFGTLGLLKKCHYCVASGLPVRERVCNIRKIRLLGVARFVGFATARAETGFFNSPTFPHFC